MAITTSPDNIPSPTSGDPYNYVVDMAAIADGTQDALTQKANMGVGTSTQRVAALGKFPDGALWYDTTTSSEWRRAAGVWASVGTQIAAGSIYADSLATGESINAYILFPFTFQSIPYVTATPRNPRLNLGISANNETGFTLRVFNWTDATASGDDIHWHAIRAR